MKIEFEPIGVIRTPFREPSGMPRNTVQAAGIAGTVELEERYVPGLRDLDGFSHIVLLFHFHRSTGYELEVVPPGETAVHGLFATRAPHRPNGIGLSIVRLDRIEGRVLHIADVDMIDGTPLLDIKPYLPSVNPGGEITTGWLGRHRAGAGDSDTDTGGR